MILETDDRIIEMRSNLEKRVRAEIIQRGFTNEQLAERLGILPIGVEILIGRGGWTLDRSAHIAHAIGLEIVIEVREEKEC